MQVNLGNSVCNVFLSYFFILLFVWWGIFCFLECLSTFVTKKKKKRDRERNVRGQRSLPVDLPLLVVVLTGPTKPRPLAALQRPRLACNDREAFH